MQCRRDVWSRDQQKLEFATKRQVTSGADEFLLGPFLLSEAIVSAPFACNAARTDVVAFCHTFRTIFFESTFNHESRIIVINTQK